MKMSDSVSTSAYLQNNGNVSSELEDGEVEENSRMEKTCTGKVRGNLSTIRLAIDFSGNSFLRPKVPCT